MRWSKLRQEELVLYWSVDWSFVYCRRNIEHELIAWARTKIMHASLLVEHQEVRILDQIEGSCGRWNACIPEIIIGVCI